MEEETSKALKHPAQARCLNDGDENSSYLVNMIKCLDDPTQERYLLITVISDFHLVRLDERNKKQFGTSFGVVMTEVGLAI